MPRLGTFIDPGNWDGTDVFVADGSGEVLIAASRVDAVQGASLRNVELEPAGLEAFAVPTVRSRALTEGAVVLPPLLADLAPRFISGDTVIVSASAPDPMRPGELGAVVAITRRKSETTYTVEFGDGRDAEVPESFLSGDIPAR